MATDPILPPIDYTSRDFLSLRQDMIELMQDRIPEWKADDAADFGVALVEAFAYTGDTLNYYLDRIANEAYLGTAVRRASILAIAAMLGYRPSLATAATTVLTFTNSTASPVVVPAATRCQATITEGGTTVVVYFETDSEITVNASSTNAVAATEGQTFGPESVGTTLGFPAETFTLPRTPVISGSEQVALLFSDLSSETWTRVDYLEDYGPTDRVFTTSTDAAGTTYVHFGDGANGAVPEANATVVTQYRVGGGESGNVPAQSITTIVEPALVGVTVSNLVPGAGGSAEESTNTIRRNASSAQRTLRRAVTVADHGLLATQVTGVAYASAEASVYSSVSVYVAPLYDGTLTPGMSGATPTAALTALKSDVATYLADKVMIGTTVTMQNPTYVPVHIEATLNLLPSSLQSTVTSQATEVLTTLLDFGNVDFGGRLVYHDLIRMLALVPGIDYADITGLWRTDTGPATGVLDLMFAADEIPYLDITTDLDLTLVGGVAG